MDNDIKHPVILNDQFKNQGKVIQPIKREETESISKKKLQVDDTMSSLLKKIAGFFSFLVIVELLVSFFFFVFAGFNEVSWTFLCIMLVCIISTFISSCVLNALSKILYVQECYLAKLEEERIIESNYRYH